MSVENLPDFNAPQYGDIDDPTRPILSFAWQADAAHRLAEHHHVRAHIIKPEAGAYWVSTPDGTWVVPVGQAIWIPSQVHHLVFSHGAVRARMLFVDAAYVAPLPVRSATVAVDPFLEQLLRRATEYGNDYPEHGPMARLAGVILDELSTLELAPLFLPSARDDRVGGVMNRLVADPGSVATLEQLASDIGASPRTIARLFRSETGMSFAQWRTRLRLVESVERLASGASVTEVALGLGYNSPSSFTYMFRTNLGVAPAAYRARAISDG